MSIEYDLEVSRLLHTVTFALNDFANAEKAYYRAKKEFHDTFKSIRTKIELAKDEIHELIRLKGVEDDRI